MGHYSPRPAPEAAPGDVFLWASSAHLYYGLCPDDVEGWAERDSSCMACYATDLMLVRAGLSTREPYLDIFWEELSEFEIDRNFEVARALVDLGEGPELLLTLLEGAAWARRRDRINHHRAELESFLANAFSSREDLLCRLDGLPGRYLLCDPAAFVVADEVSSV